MKNKQIFLTILIVCMLYIMSITVYANDEYLNDELDYTIGINAFDSDNNIKDKFISYYKGYMTTYMNNRGYIWACCIKSDVNIKLLYCTDEPIEPISNGYKYSVASDSGIDDLITKPNFDNTDTQWFIYPLSSPKVISDFSFDKGVEYYEYNVDINSTLPVYYKTFENNSEYDDWYNNETFNLKNNPNQDYGTHGFNPKGDYDNGEDYDLEVPKDLKCKGFDSSTIVSSFKDDKVLTWNQSDNIDVKDWYTEIYLREVGTFKRYIWSSKETFDSGYTKQWNLYGNVLNAKRKYTFKFDDIKAYPCTPTGEEMGGISQITDYYVKMRNTYFDESTKRMHYSNWITWHIDDKGNVDCVENEDHDVTNTDKDDVKIDSDNYKPGDDYTNKNKDTTVDSFTLDSFLSYLRQAVDTVGEIPTMLGTVFSWLPAVFTTMIVCGIGLLVLLRILNR